MASKSRWTSQPPGYVVQSFWHRSCQFSSKMNFKSFTDTFFVTISESKIYNCMVYKNLDRGKESTWRLQTCSVYFITAELWSDSDWPMNTFKTTIIAHSCGVEKGNKTLPEWTSWCLKQQSSSCWDFSQDLQSSHQKSTRKPRLAIMILLFEIEVSSFWLHRIHISCTDSHHEKQGGLANQHKKYFQISWCQQEKQYTGGRIRLKYFLHQLDPGSWRAWPFSHPN